MLFSRKRKFKKKPRDPAKTILLKQAAIGIFLVCFFSALATGVYYGSRIEALTISEVEIIGGQTISHDEIREIVETVLDGAYFALVPYRFSWTFPHDAIEAKITTKERIKNIHTEVSERTKLIIVFEEYRPVALWCKKQASKECLFVDSEGYAYTTAPYLEGTAFMRYSDNARTPAVGLYMFDKDFISMTNSFVENAYDSLELNIIHVEQSSEEDVVYYVSGGGMIKASLRMTTEDTLKNLETILTSEAFSHLEPGNFQYIDLRFGNKIFVNEELATSTAETTSKKTSTSTER